MNSYEEDDINFIIFINRYIYIHASKKKMIKIVSSVIYSFIYSFVRSLGDLPSW